MKQIIQGDLRPVMADLFRRVKEGGPDLVMDGVPAYNERAQFVGGKVINMACYTALELLGTEESLRDLGEIIRMVSGMKMETWGILNGITGLYRLQCAGLLEKVVDPETLTRLRQAFDWRTFVDEADHYALIHKPTNYYGVAFGIARHRELLGWEPEGHSRHLLNRLMEHIDRYSGALSFMDETPGQGRFDRYSVLVPSELTAQLLGTGWPVPDKIQGMLSRSAQIFLQLANEEGQGFPYGRSIGAYGDTAGLEVLSAAAELGLLQGDEAELGYAYSVRLMRHMLDFWYDRGMASVNMWEHGRKTDTYRNKNRILGENLALCMQMVNSYEHWAAAGWGNRPVCEDYARRLAALAPHTFVRFAQGEYERGLAIVRDGRRVWALPLINGGENYYDKDAYMPAPFQNGVLQGVPEYSHCQLVPQLWMEDGTVLLPLAYFRRIEPQEEAGRMTVRCTMDALCVMGRGVTAPGGLAVDEGVDLSQPGWTGEENRPHRAEGFSAETVYTFAGHAIRREDAITIPAGRKVKQVRLVLLSYADAPETEGCTLRFAEGPLARMKAEGYGTCRALPAPADGSCDTPQGRLRTVAVWTGAPRLQGDTLRLAWQLDYRP